MFHLLGKVPICHPDVTFGTHRINVANLSYIFLIKYGVSYVVLCILSRIDGKPEDVLNPKKKQLEKITPVCICISFTSR